MNKPDIYDLVVIGGGAAGFFGAIACKQHAPNKRVAIIDQHSKFLTKVSISGGGRCNLTHHCFDVPILVKHYPRGNKELVGVFNIFQPTDTVSWFEERGVKTKTEIDGRMFPESNTSASVVDCLIGETHRLGITCFNSIKVKNISIGDHYIITTNRQSFITKNILLASGGITTAITPSYLLPLQLDLIEPVPSLFSFHIPSAELQALSGISVTNAEIKISGKKNTYSGPLLITHQGMSGPAILKTSAFEAIYLHQLAYQFSICINWVGMNEDALRSYLKTYKDNYPAQYIGNAKFNALPKRLYHFLLEKSEIALETRWADLSVKKLNKLVSVLCCDTYPVDGKSPNKEEFVTAGGINLQSIDFKTMRIKSHSGIYAAGEILNIDGVTGGFNFQAAWSTGYIAGIAIANKED